jgi:hypothetical protein
MQTLMLVLFVTVFAGAVGFVAGRVWEIRSGQSRPSLPIDLVLQQPASPVRLLARIEPPMGF